MANPKGGGVNTTEDEEVNIAPGSTEVKEKNVVVSLPQFQVVCMDMTTKEEQEASKFGLAAHFKIIRKMGERLDEINAARTKKFYHYVHFVQFGVTSLPVIQPWDVVIYFVGSPSHSIAKQDGGRSGGEGAAGWTMMTNSGTTCEVYVGGNGPADKLANLALHEMMHVKLDVGQTVVTDIHTLSPKSDSPPGISRTPTESWHRWNASEKTHMTTHIFDNVRVNQRHMTTRPSWL